VAGALAGCGQTSGPSNGVARKSAEGGLADAAAAARAAGSVHFVGSGVQAYDDTPYEYDLRISEEGAVGRVSFHDRAVDLLRIGDTVYFKAPPDFYTYESDDLAHDTIAAELFGNRWIAMETDRMFEYLTVVIPELRRTVVGGLLSPERGRYVNAGETTLSDGRTAVALTDARAKTTLYVSATGEPLPIEWGDADDTEELTLSDWGEPVELEAPADAIELSGVQTMSVAHALTKWLPSVG
jgi:hypothetical protein